MGEGEEKGERGQMGQREEKIVASSDYWLNCSSWLPLSPSHRWNPRKTTAIFLLSSGERNCKQRWTNWTLLSPRLSLTSKFV